MIRIEIDVTDVAELKAQLKGLLNEPVKSTVTVTPENVTVAAPQIKEVKAPKAKKAEPVKEEPKTAVAAELTEDQKTELRTLCAEYTHKVADGKERIKQFLKDKGLAIFRNLKRWYKSDGACSFKRIGEFPMVALHAIGKTGA